MEWTNTPQSSHISGFAYSEADRRLYIEFKGRTIYTYEDVPRKYYLSLKMEKSKGVYFNRAIKSAFRCQRLDGATRHQLNPPNQLEIPWKTNSQKNSTSRAASTRV